MSVNLLTEQCLELRSLKGGCTGWSEATLVKMPHCWKSHVTAHFKITAVLYVPFLSVNNATLLGQVHILFTCKLKQICC